MSSRLAQSPSKPTAAALALWLVLVALPAPLLAQTISLAEELEDSQGLPTEAWIVIAVTLSAVIAASLFFVLRGKPDAPNAQQRGLSKETRRRVNEAVTKGDYETAGDLLLRAEEFSEAAELYVRGKIYSKAAQTYQSTGNLAQAIHYFKKDGNFAQAARLYAEDGQHRAAAAEFHQAGDYRSAAQQYAEAGDDRRAAENYERACAYLLAGEAYFDSGAVMKAAENYALGLDEALSKEDGLEGLTEEVRRGALQAADLFKEAGDLERASDLYKRAGFFEKAAECLRTSGDYSRAAELLLEAQQPLKAAEFFEQAGEEKRAQLMRAQAALDEGDGARAAELYEEAGDFDQAIELYEGLEMYSEAAVLHDKMGDQERAYQLYLDEGLHAHAARSAELLGRLAEAAELYQEVGDVEGQLRVLMAQESFFRAGRLLYEHRRFDEALDALKSIDSRDPIYRRGLELQGDILSSQGRHAKAYSQYRAAMGKRRTDAETLPLVYKMARSLEEETDLSGAMGHYQAIIEVDADFEDASSRLKAIRDQLRRGTASGLSASGVFGTNRGSNEAGVRRYEMIEEIARGGMGIVYKARDTVLGRVVAFKILGENLRDNEVAVKYFLREARAAAAMAHQNIVTIYDAGEQEGEYYMAMEFVEGTTLKDIVRQHGAMTERQLFHVLVGCCKALDYAHTKGIIHRDIKSGNVMITRDHTIKIMDFGLAKFLREYQNNHTQQVGTPFYMSPEQIIGRDVDFRSDLYSLGCTIFECATGTVPFFKGDLAYHHIHTSPPKPSSINPALSRKLESIILQMLAKDPNDRFQSARALLQQIAVARSG